MKKQSDPIEIEKLILIKQDGKMLEYEETSPKNVHFQDLKLICLTNKSMTYGVLYFPTDHRVYQGGILFTNHNYKPNFVREGLGWQMIVPDM